MIYEINTSRYLSYIPVFLKWRRLEINKSKSLHHNVEDIHVCQQESIIYMPLKKHLRIHSTWYYRLVVKALNYNTVGDTLDLLRQRKRNSSGLSHHQKCLGLSHVRNHQSCWRQLESPPFVEQFYFLQLCFLGKKKKIHIVPKLIWNSTAWLNPK